MGKKHMLITTGWISIGLSMLGYILLIVHAELSKLIDFTINSRFDYIFWSYINKPLFAICSIYCAASIIMLICGMAMRGRQ